MGKTAAAEAGLQQAGFDEVLGPRRPGCAAPPRGADPVVFQLGRYRDARVLLRDTVNRLERLLPEDDPLITELRECLADIGEKVIGIRSSGRRAG